jgi:hypothetical protein
MNGDQFSGWREESLDLLLGPQVYVWTVFIPTQRHLGLYAVSAYLRVGASTVDGGCTRGMDGIRCAAGRAFAEAGPAGSSILT